MRTAGRRRTTGGADGDGYLASVSDLMSSLIFIFVITLAVFALRLAKETETVITTIEDLTAADKTRQQILKDIAIRLENAGIKVTVLHEHGVLRLSEKGILFPSGIEEPHKDYAERVGYLARVLAEVIPCYVAPSLTTQSPVVAQRPAYCSTPGKLLDYSCNRKTFSSHLETLLIEGHTDTQPVSTGRRFRDNLELSSIRAATVYRMIEACEPGIVALLNNKRFPVLSTSGYGAMRLSKPEEPHAEENRRIDLRFLMETPASGKSSDPPEPITDPNKRPVQTEVREKYEGN